MNIDFGAINLETFLAEYWQQKPCLLKGGFKNFKDPIDADELAGLAAEEFIESRLISHENGKWQAMLGPFEEYEHLGASNWTLVVQSVNHFVDEAQALADQFKFIPQWRLDDVMVSFACKDGSVGPHIDFYDVFICQGTGKRHWRVAERGDYKEVIPHEKLKHIEPFEDSIIDAIVESGDILYIPPGFPHEGVSLDNSLSFSVGYKSTNANELISGFADYLIDHVTEPRLLKDPNREKSEFGQISLKDQSLIVDLLHSALKTDRCNDFIGCYYTEASHELDLLDSNLTESEFLNRFKTENLTRCNGLKVIYLEQDNVAFSNEPDKQWRFFANGHPVIIEGLLPESRYYICNHNILEASYLEKEFNNSAFVLAMTVLVNKGYWFFKESC